MSIELYGVNVGELWTVERTSIACLTTQDGSNEIRPKTENSLLRLCENLAGTFQLKLFFLFGTQHVF